MMKVNFALCAWRASPGQGRSGSSAGPVKAGHTRTAQMEGSSTLATTVTPTRPTEPPTPPSLSVVENV